jgi:hypothetical protein
MLLHYFFRSNSPLIQNKFIIEVHVAELYILYKKLYK